MAIDVLGDMVTSSLVTSDDVEAEREVILDEIAMHDDDPDDVVHNLFAETAWAGTPLGRPIAGTRRVDPGAHPHADQPLLPRRYVAPREHGRRGRRQRRPRGRRTPGASRRSRATTSSPRPTPAPSRRGRPAGPGRCASGEARTSRPFEQVNLVLGMRGLTRSDMRRHTLACSTPRSAAAPRPGCSRRCASAAAWPTRSTRSPRHYSDAGMVGVAAGCLPAKVDDVLAVVARGARQGRPTTG